MPYQSWDWRSWSIFRDNVSQCHSIEGFCLLLALNLRRKQLKTFTAKYIVKR